MSVGATAVTTSAATRGSADRFNSLAGRAGNDAAFVQHRHAIRERARLGDVVRHQDHRALQGRLHARELVVQLPLGDGIERAERLVHQQQRRIRGEGAGEADALALAAGQFVGPAAAIHGRLESDQRQQLVDASGDARRRPAKQLRDQRNVVGDGEVREQAGVLNHVTGPPAQDDRIPLANLTIFDEHSTRIRFDQAIDQSQEGGLAGAAAADQRHGLVGANRQRQLVQHTAPASTGGDVFKRDGGSGQVAECTTSSTASAARSLAPGPPSRLRTSASDAIMRAR